MTSGQIKRYWEQVMALPDAQDPPKKRVLTKKRFHPSVRKKSLCAERNP